MIRSDFLRGLIGKPWRAAARGPDAYDCWALVVHVERHLFGRVLPEVDTPQEVTWAYLLDAFASHPERRRWHECPADAMGLTCAPDGAIVLMARSNRAAHAGVLLRPERSILHADHRQGACLDGPAYLNARGWRKLLYFEHAAD